MWGNICKVETMFYNFDNILIPNIVEESTPINLPFVLNEPNHYCKAKG